MDSEEAAYASAQQKHNKYMVFGKKNRYIEVFQCSGDDMNLVLNGGVHSPVNPRKSPLLSPGMLNQPQQQTQSLPSPGLSLTLSQPLALSITRPHQSPNSALLAQQAQLIAQQNLIARQQAAANAAVAAATVSQNVTQTSDQSQYYIQPNFTLIQSPTNTVNSAAAAAAAAVAAAQNQLIAPNNHQTVHHSQANATQAQMAQTHHQQHQFLFMPRSMQNPQIASHLTSPMSSLIPTMNFIQGPYGPHSTQLSLLSPHSLVQLRQQQQQQQQTQTHPHNPYTHPHSHHPTTHSIHSAHQQSHIAQQAALQQITHVGQEMLLHGRHPSMAGTDFSRLNRDQNLQRYMHGMALPTPNNPNTTLLHAASIKRSYDSAFLQDPSTSPLTTANAPKRFYL